MLRRKSKTLFLKQERNKQNAIALLNYLKHIALQQLMLRTQVFTKKIKMQRTQPQVFKEIFLVWKILLFIGFELRSSNYQPLDLTTVL